jgi:hypothetical protein
VTPSLWSAYRTRHPAGISRGIWLLILAELTCWGLYGIRSSDPRLICEASRIRQKRGMLNQHVICPKFTEPTRYG